MSKHSYGFSRSFLHCRYSAVFIVSSLVMICSMIAGNPQLPITGRALSDFTSIKKLLKDNKAKILFTRKESDGGADLLVLSELIYTAELADPWVEAFTVKDGVFTYVGDLYGALDYIGSSTVIIDATDYMVTPGFVDNHCHYLWIGALVSMMPWNLINCNSVDEVKAVVKKTAGSNPALPFVGGIGWRNDYIPGGKPDKTMLDDVVSNRPVLLMSYGGQSGWANSYAVDLMYSRDPDEFNELSPELDDSGEPTGFFKRFHCFNPFKFFKEEEMALAERPMISAMWHSVNEALSLGITSVNDVQLYRDFYKYLSKFKEQGGLSSLRARVSYYVGPGMFQNSEKLQEDLIWWTGLSTEPYSDDHLKLGDSVKLYIDGVDPNHTAFMFEPYTDDPSTVGVPDWTQEQFDTVINLLDSMRLQACTHACGDAGINRVINSYESVIQSNPEWDRRHRIEHCPLPIAADRTRMASLGIVAAMQATHFAGGPSDIYIGDRVQSLMPWRSMIDAGIDVCFGSDWCAGPANPAYGLLVSATRLNYKLETDWGPEEAITFEEGLYLYTAKSAYALKMEDIIGSIKAGKKADFVIFAEDLTDILTYRNILIQKSEMGSGLDDLVLATFTDGNIAYCKTGWTMLDVRKAKVRFNFVVGKELTDSLSVTGTLEWPDDLPLTDAEVSVSVGGVQYDFILDKKGRGWIDRNTTIKISRSNGILRSLGLRRFKLNVKKASLFDGFKSYGFIKSTTIKKPGEVFSVPVIFIIDQELQATMVDFTYTVREEKSGSAKGKSRPFELPTWLSWYWDETI